MATDQSLYRSGNDRRFYTWVAIISALIVLTGFARTYYLKGVFGAPALSGLVHLHGLVMTSWVILFIVQVRLVAAHRIDWHRRLGVIGGVLAALMVVVGISTAIAAAKRGATPGPPALKFLAVPFVDMLVFAMLIATGLFLRRQKDVHKRVMLLTSVGILAPAFARIPLHFIEVGGPLAFFGLTDLCIIACIAFDTIKHRRLHPAFGWGALLIIASQPLRLMLAETSAWMQFATWLTR